jgi:putative endonuclease
MYCVYILYSQKLSRFYIGTSDNVYRKLDAHNAGLKKDAFTYRGIPWEFFIIIDK